MDEASEPGEPSCRLRDATGEMSRQKGWLGQRGRGKQGIRKQKGPTQYEIAESIPCVSDSETTDRVLCR